MPPPVCDHLVDDDGDDHHASREAPGLESAGSAVRRGMAAEPLRCLWERATGLSGPSRRLDAHRPRGQVCHVVALREGTSIQLRSPPRFGSLRGFRTIGFTWTTGRHLPSAGRVDGAGVRAPSKEERRHARTEVVGGHALFGGSLQRRALGAQPRGCARSASTLCGSRISRRLS